MAAQPRPRGVIDATSGVVTDSPDMVDSAASHATFSTKLNTHARTLRLIAKFVAERGHDGQPSLLDCLRGAGAAAGVNVLGCKERDLRLQVHNSPL